MFSLRSKTSAAPKTVDIAAVIHGLRTFANDLEANDSFAVEMAGPTGEMPVSGEEWAAYPISPDRLDRLAYFGGPSEEDIPDDVFDAMLRANGFPFRY